MHETGIILAENQCPSCHKTQRDDAHFCSNCGYALHSVVDTSGTAGKTDAISAFVAHWGEIKKIAWLSGILLFNSLILSIVRRVDSTPWPGVITAGVDAAIIFSFFIGNYATVSGLLAPPKLTIRRTLELFGVAIAFILLMSAYFALIKHMGVPMIQVSAKYIKNDWPIWSIFLLTSIMPAIFEELAFRGVIQVSLEKIFNEREAWLIQGALFALLHLLPIAFPSHFVMGLFFGYMRLRSKSLYPGMLLHATWNAIALCNELYWR